MKRYKFNPWHLATLMRRWSTNKTILADYLNVRRATLYDWINGNTEPKPSQLAKLANYYDERIERFFDGAILDDQ